MGNKARTKRNVATGCVDVTDKDSGHLGESFGGRGSLFIVYS